MPYFVLKDYVDRMVSQRWAACIELSVPNPQRDHLDPVVWTKAADTSSADDPMHLVVAAHARTRTALLNFTDGNMNEVAGVLIAALVAQQNSPFLGAGHVTRLEGSPYLAERGLVAALFLFPDAVYWSTDVDHRPIGELAGWHLYLVVPITEDEYLLGRRDIEALFRRFEEGRRDLMTVQPPFRIPD